MYGTHIHRESWVVPSPGKVFQPQQRLLIDCEICLGERAAFPGASLFPEGGRDLAFCSLPRCLILKVGLGWGVVERAQFQLWMVEAPWFLLLLGRHLQPWCRVVEMHDTAMPQLLPCQISPRLNSARRKAAVNSETPAHLSLAWLEWPVKSSAS